MLDPPRGQLGRDLHRGYKCFNREDHNSNVARQRRTTSTKLLLTSLPILRRTSTSCTLTQRAFLSLSNYFSKGE
jgi:hypothetical protein